MTQAEVIIVDLHVEKQMNRLKQIAALLDSRIQIPGTNFRFGLDAIIGLIPGIGDGLGAALSLYVIYLSAQLGVRKITLLKMVGNVFIDALIGVVPLFGDFFDIVWKANSMNLELALNEVENFKPISRSNRSITRFIVLILLFSFLSLIVVMSALFIGLIKMFF